MDKLRFWCQKVLPLVYDDSLSYMELLCKVVSKLNEVIETYGESGETIQELQEAVAKLQKWVDNFDTSYLEKLVLEYISKVIKQVYFGLTDSGYFVAYIPHGWEEIEFGTIQTGPLYGHLTLSY